MSLPNASQAIADDAQQVDVAVVGAGFAGLYRSDHFTNPVGLITQAVSLRTSLRVVGVCDTPSSTLEMRKRFVSHAKAGEQMRVSTSVPV